MPPRFFVIGCGSIGQRHIGNLQTLGIEDIHAFDVKAERRAQTRSRFKIPAVQSLEEGWAQSPDVAVIAAPTGQHVQLALEAAGHSCHLFIEKPLGDSLDGTEELLATVADRGLVTLVGCNMRFHHGPATIKQLLDDGAAGHVTSALIDAGQYLPDWHPEEDYRLGYSARMLQGGGVVLDGTHEIDYARWLFGEVTQVYSQGGKLSSLEIDTEDTADILMQMAAGSSVGIHIDYVQRAYWRTCKVIGEEGTIVWDMSKGEVRLYSASQLRWQTFHQPVGYEINQMYLDEMQHFLRCLEGSEEPALDVRDAKRVLEIALAVKDSMRSGERKRVAA